MKLALVLFILTAIAAPLAAGPVCADRDIIVQKLAEKYGEVQRGLGLTGNGQVVELFASEKTGTWTITATRPDGSTCLIAAGEDWNHVEPVPLPAPTTGDPL
jgi:hypothetical protein